MNKIIYGLGRLLREIRGKTDYWHIASIPRSKSEIELGKYYLDFTAKAYYEGEIYENGIPVLYIDNVRVLFSITIFNYGLGLLELDDELRIKALVKWALEAVDSDGFWRNDYYVSYYDINNWRSALSQGLGISFLIRAMRYYSHDKQFEIRACLDKAVRALLSNDLCREDEEGYKILQEFGSVNNDVLNGHIFGIYALLDYDREFGTGYSYIFIEQFSVILKRYKFGLNWSYYDNKGTLASRFYHDLHLAMVMSLLNLGLVEDSVIKFKYSQVEGVLMTLLKALQKIRKVGSISVLK